MVGQQLLLVLFAPGLVGFDGGDEQFPALPLPAWVLVQLLAPRLWAAPWDAAHTGKLGKAPVLSKGCAGELSGNACG